MKNNTLLFRHNIKAGYADSFRSRHVQPSALMGFLEETAAEHCRSIGRDVFSLLDGGQGWVLTGGGLHLNRYPVYGEEIEIETWISEWKKFSGIREYRIYDAEGKTIGEAGGRWVYWDIDRRKPMAIPEVFRRGWSLHPESPYRRMYPDSTTPAIPESLPGDVPERLVLRVRRGDVDLYGHLHNTIYLDWLMESIPEDVYLGEVPMNLGMRFFGEALLGDEVSIQTGRSVKGSGSGWTHEVRRLRDDKLLVRGFSDWSRQSIALSA